MGSRSIVYTRIYALIDQHTILVERIVSRDGLPRGVLPSGILKIEKYCPGLKVRSPVFDNVKGSDASFNFWKPYSGSGEKTESDAHRISI